MWNTKVYTWSHIFFNNKTTNGSMGKFKIRIHFELGNLVGQVQKCFRIHFHPQIISSFFPHKTGIYIYYFLFQLIFTKIVFRNKWRTEATLGCMITKITIYFSFPSKDWGKAISCVCIEWVTYRLHISHLPAFVCT